jgi:hypothetical protein
MVNNRFFWFFNVFYVYIFTSIHLLGTFSSVGSYARWPRTHAEAQYGIVPEKEKKKKIFRGPRVWATTIVRPSVCRRKSVSHFKAREITFSGLITLRKPQTKRNARLNLWSVPSKRVCYWPYMRMVLHVGHCRTTLEGLSILIHSQE